MSWQNIKNLEYPVLDADGECIAIFLSKQHRDKFVDMINSSLTDKQLFNLQLEAGDYVDFDVDISIRGS